MHTGERIREERERLGFNQADFAALAGATRKTLFNWESGAASPNAAALAAWAEVGLDVLYVVTGQRAGGASAPPPPRAVSEGDRILLDNFHAAPAQVQAGVKTALGAFAPAGAGVKSRKRAA